MPHNKDNNQQGKSAGHPDNRATDRKPGEQRHDIDQDQMKSTKSRDDRHDSYRDSMNNKR